MPNPCSICRHPKRDAIDAALVALGSTRGIAALFGDISISAIGRHRNTHIRQTIIRANTVRKYGLAEREDVVIGDPGRIDSETPVSAILRAENVLAALQAHIERVNQLVADSLSEDVGSRVAALREARQTLQLRAKLAGLLEPDTASITVDNRRIEVVNVIEGLSEAELRAIASVGSP